VPQVPRVSYAAKLISAGVAVKAVLMGVLVSIVAASTTFTESIVLVLVSALATGAFGIIIVLVQTHAERAMHKRLDNLEAKADTAADRATVAAEKTEKIAEAIAPEANA
jgi:low affinity Fe/Cu permease